MIPIPKPKFIKEKYLIDRSDISEDDFEGNIIRDQSHVLRDAIDRVSRNKHSKRMILNFI